MQETSSTLMVAVAFGSVGAFLQQRLNSIKNATTKGKKEEEKKKMGLSGFISLSNFYLLR